MTTNIQKVVEDWSAKEVEWKRQHGSLASEFSSLIFSDVRQQIIKEYKESNVYIEEVNLKVANEFDEGFEYVKKLVREKRLNPAKVGIVYP